ncbi:hypothetical protein [Dermacoccus nishinomiyaensis]|uniref:hypothetical protein n=1 Tax=Dermacoccus nishinomiyaensis TaxID=1274 RepID=UPI0033AF203C
MDDPTTGGTEVIGDYNIAVFAKRPLTSRVKLDPSVGGYGDVSQATAPEDWFAACVEATVQSIKTRACSVHLWPNFGTPYDTSLTATQAKNLSAQP